MNELLEIIKDLILGAHSRVYLEDAPETAVFPYVVFNLVGDIIINEGGRNDFTLEVDIWDDDQDTTTLEALTDDIDLHLDRINQSSSTIAVNFYKTGRDMIPDPSLKRRQLRYQTSVYFT